MCDKLEPVLQIKISSLLDNKHRCLSINVYQDSIDDGHAKKYLMENVEKTLDELLTERV